MRQLRWLLLPVGAFALSNLTGCKTHIPFQVSTGGPVMKNVKVLGPTEGYASAKYFLGGLVGPVGDDSLEAAVADALSKKGGDSLISMTVDREVKTVPIFMREIRTRVTGVAVKY